ncbi:ISAzo13-like element transposase-related protein [Nostoc sp.]|uniref:ISAzo13-like element transposase-related protein n=1 Tax=Nostoc sp. TaxID=1180 RepID=UPI002FFC647A
MKKIPQTDAIFDNVFRENQASDENPKSLRVSIDTKAQVKIGNLSRGGKARTLEAKAAEATYEKGIKVLSQELELYQNYWQRSETLPKWDITIFPA